LDILGHDSHTLGVNSTQVSILEKTNKVCLCCFLKGKDCSGLETKISLEILGDLTDEALEGCLTDEEIGGLLVFTDLTESYSSRTVSVGFLDSSCGGCRLTGSLGCELFYNSSHSRGVW
jgi:hypothetical protein